jgi:A/G-specific adenine glycosylase
MPLLRERLLVAGQSGGDATPVFADARRFVARVLEQGRVCYRDLPWRQTTDAYAVLVSEVMLQQTQVARVVPKYEAWLEQFPSVDALASVSFEAVLTAWRGLGYSRRAIALKRTAEQVASEHGGRLPVAEKELRLLPGVGPTTAAGVVVFAHDRPAVYLETNVRAVFLHECFPGRQGVSDREIAPLARLAVGEAKRQGAGPREWHTALLDYGAHLKRTVPNPSRRSAAHSRQSRFEGSRRQKRAWLLHAVIDMPGRSAEQLAHELAAVERAADRQAPAEADVAGMLRDLASDGFLVQQGDCWLIAERVGAAGFLAD